MSYDACNNGRSFKGLIRMPHYHQYRCFQARLGRRTPYQQDPLERSYHHEYINYLSNKQLEQIADQSVSNRLPVPDPYHEHGGRALGEPNYLTNLTAPPPHTHPHLPSSAHANRVHNNDTQPAPAPHHQPRPDLDRIRIAVASATIRLDGRIRELQQICNMLDETQVPSQAGPGPSAIGDFAPCPPSARNITAAAETLISLDAIRVLLEEIREMRGNGLGPRTPGDAEEVGERLVGATRTLRRELREKSVEYAEMKRWAAGTSLVGGGIRAYEEEGALETLKVKIAAVLKKELRASRSDERDLEIEKLTDGLKVDKEGTPDEYGNRDKRSGRRNNRDKASNGGDNWG